MKPVGKRGDRRCIAGDRAALCPEKRRIDERVEGEQRAPDAFQKAGRSIPVGHRLPSPRLASNLPPPPILSTLRRNLNA